MIFRKLNGFFNPEVKSNTGTDITRLRYYTSDSSVVSVKFFDKMGFNTR